MKTCIPIFIVFGCDHIELEAHLRQIQNSIRSSIGDDFLSAMMIEVRVIHQDGSHVGVELFLSNHSLTFLE